MKINRLRVSAVSAVAVLAIAAAGAGVVSAAAPDQTGIEAAASESGGTGIEADGVGGHQDPAGQNVDHQFQGDE